MNLPAVLILTALAVVPSPSPSSTPGPASAPQDACVSGGHTALLAVLDRPTVGFSSCPVALHDVLLEAGMQFNRGSNPQTQIGQTIWRYGAAPRIEFDAIGPTYINLRGPGSGYSDAGAGAKWQFFRSGASSAAIDALFTVPSGAPALTAGLPTQTLNLDFGTSAGNFGLAATTAFTRGNPSADVFTIALTNQFDRRTQWYAEGIQQFGAAGSAWGGDAGLQYLLTGALEIDAEAGALSGRGSTTHWTGFGFGLRF